MQGDDIPARYTALVAKRPELAVRCLRWMGCEKGWMRSWPDGDTRIQFIDEAHALIGWHLTRAMKGTGYTLCAPCPYSSNPITSAWHIALCGIHYHFPAPWFGSHDDPLSALLTFWEQQP